MRPIRTALGQYIYMADEVDAELAALRNKITLLRAFLQAQVAQCKSPIPCQSCEALQTLLDATA